MILILFVLQEKLKDLMESTLPSLDIIRLNYMKDNPGHSFGFTDTGIECPLERNGVCDRNGIRYRKWINFITSNSINVAKIVSMEVPNIILPQLQIPTIT